MGWGQKKPSKRPPTNGRTAPVFDHKNDRIMGRSLCIELGGARVMPALLSPRGVDHFGSWARRGVKKTGAIEIETSVARRQFLTRNKQKRSKYAPLESGAACVIPG